LTTRITGFIVWLALYIPALPLQAFSHTLIETAPVAVFERDARRPRIVARNLKAARLGITLHSSLAQATALSDALITLPREPLREAALLTQLAEASSGLTPNIHIHESFGLLLDVASSLALFGGPHALQRQAEIIAQQQRVRTHIVLAPTASGARWLARAHRQLVAPGPINPWLDDLCLENTDFSSALIAELHALNLHSLEAVRRLPSAEINRRFGTPVTLAIARAYAEATETLAFWQPIVRFAESVEFLDPAREQSHWMPGVEALALQLQEFLRTRAATTSAIVFGFHLGTQSCTELTLLAAHGTHLASDWLRLFNARIERLPITHEISSISLSCEHTEPMRFADVDLFDKSKERDHEWSALTALLKQRLGDDALRPPHHHNNALPESATTIATTAVEGQAANLRPAWLVDPPRPLTAHEVSLFTQSFHMQHPERIHEHWSHPDGNPSTLRDYYIAKTPDHRALWVFRERLRNAWFLQGVFA
jgi:protein ImuB